MNKRGDCLPPARPWCEDGGMSVVSRATDGAFLTEDLFRHHGAARGATSTFRMGSSGRRRAQENGEHGSGTFGGTSDA
jgi:hypothetical protein